MRPFGGMHHDRHASQSNIAQSYCAKESEERKPILPNTPAVSGIFLLSATIGHLKTGIGASIVRSGRLSFARNDAPRPYAVATVVLGRADAWKTWHWPACRSRGRSGRCWSRKSPRILQGEREMRKRRLTAMVAFIHTESRGSAHVAHTSEEGRKTKTPGTVVVPGIFMVWVRGFEPPAS